MKFKIEYGSRRQGFKVWNETRKVLRYIVVIDDDGNMGIHDHAGEQLALFSSYPKFILTLTDKPRRYVMRCKDGEDHNWLIRSEEDVYETLRYADKMTCIFQDGICIGKIGYEKGQWLYRYIDFEMLDNYNPALLLAALLYFFQPIED